MQQNGHYLNHENEFSRIQAMIACSNAVLDSYSETSGDISHAQAVLSESLERLGNLKNAINEQSYLVERDRAEESQ
jgi:hypothetical protein